MMHEVNTIKDQAEDPSWSNSPCLDPKIMQAFCGTQLAASFLA